MRRASSTGDPELIDCRPLPAWPAEFHACHFVEPRGVGWRSRRRGPRGRSSIEFPDGKTRDTQLWFEPAAAAAPDTTPTARRRHAVWLQANAAACFLKSSDATLGAALVVDGSETGPVAVKLETGRRGERPAARPEREAARRRGVSRCSSMGGAAPGDRPAVHPPPPTPAEEKRSALASRDLRRQDGARDRAERPTRTDGSASTGSFQGSRST